MPFNINEITSAINEKNGLIKKHNFMVMVYPPTNLQSEDFRALPFFCEACALPGIVFEAQPVKMHGLGLFERRPFNPIFTEWACQLMVDGQANMVKVFHKWLQLINQFNADMTSNRSSGGKLNYEFEYPENYEGRVEIYLYDDSGQQVLMYTLYNAYPKDFPDAGLSWDASNEIMRINLAFSYKHWTNEAIDNGTEGVSDSLMYSLPRIDSGVAGAVSGILRNSTNIAGLINNVLNQNIYIPYLNSIF